MSEHVWAKVYLELPTDPKLVGRSAHDRYLWVCLILLAKASAEQGVIPAWQTESAYLSKYTAISKPEVTRALIYFREVGMVDYDERGQMVLSHFPERQASKDPTAAERMRRLRERSGSVTRKLRVEADRTPNGVQEAEAELSANADVPIAEMFEAYRLNIQPTAKFIPAARDKIRTRLKTFTADELLKAIKNFSLDKWEMSHNAHRGAAWFFDSDKRIEQYVNLGAAVATAYRPTEAVY